MRKFDQYKEKSLVFNFLSVSKKIEKTLNASLLEMNLGVPGAFCLLNIFIEDLEGQTVSSADLGALLETSKSHTSQLTLRLMGLRLITEMKDAKDKRKSLWVITEKGKQAAIAVMTVFETLESSLEGSVNNPSVLLGSLRDLRL